MADRYWIGGTGNWSDTDHWAEIAIVPDIVDSYSESNKDSSENIYSGNYPASGQSFTGDGGVLNSAEFLLGKNGSPTGSCYAKIYAHTGTYGTSSIPTGSPIAVSDAFNVANITGDYFSGLSLEKFIFSGENKITLVDGTKYVVVFEYSGGDSSNYVFIGLVGLDSSSPTASGNKCYYYDESWGYESDNDLCFYVYKDSNGFQAGATVPTSSDNVIVDENSGFDSGGTITVEEEGNYCHNFSAISGHEFSIEESQSAIIEIHGSAIFETGLEFNINSIYFVSSENETITANSFSCNSNLSISGEGTFEIQDDLALNYSFNQYNGTFDANGYNVTANDFYFYADTGNAPIVYMGSGTWEATGGDWYVDEYNGEVVVINAESSTIKLTGTGQSLFFYDDTASEEGKSYYNVWMDFNTYGLIVGNNVFNNLKINQGATVYFEDGSVQIVDSFTANGSLSNVITLDSENGAYQFVLSKPTGIVECDYLNILNSNATGGATWYAGANSLDTANNDGWIFEDRLTNIVQSIIST
jgi:hypothetical protein